MAKQPKPSMADALARIAAEAPDNAATLPRDDVSTSQLEMRPVSRENVTTSRTTTTSDGFKIRQRIERPHASIYAHPKVFKAIRETAAAEGRKPHDLSMDGLRLMLKAYGRDLDALNRGE